MRAIIDALAKIGGPIAHDVILGVAADPGSSQIDRVFARSALGRM